MDDKRNIKFTCILDDKLELLSLCPSLGKRYSVVTYGMCPSNLQNPFGKVLQIAVAGTAPYIMFNEAKEWVGGIEFEVIDVYVKKFGLIPAGYEGEGSVVDMVRKVYSYHHCKMIFTILSYRSAKSSVKLG